MEEAASFPQADIALNALVGVAGLNPTIWALEAGKQLALANKESLVCAGEIVMDLAAQKGIGFCRWTANIRRFFSPWAIIPTAPFAGFGSRLPAGLFSEEIGKNWRM